MKTRKNYATKLTKEELIKAGITLVTEEGYVFKGDKQVIPTINSAGYWMIQIYDLDEDGNKIKNPIRRQFKGCTKVSDSYVYKVRTLGLHRVMWAWHFSEVPSGYVVDHISNKHDSLDDYRLENLQLLTPGENLAKERNCNTKQIPCSLKKPLSWYENRLQMYLDQHEEAKKNHAANECHRLRANIANTKAKIRYYLAHKEEAEKIQMENETIRLEEQARREAKQAKVARLRELQDFAWAARMRYLEAQQDYGADHFVTQCCKEEWHEAVRARNAFLDVSE